MTRLNDTAQLLVSSWRLASDQTKVPTSQGLLGAALKEAFDRGAFPEWMRREIHFADARLGLQCVELPAILNRAQEALLTTAPNPSYRFTEVQVSSKVAATLVQRLGVSEDQARSWGRVLLECLEAAEAEARAFEALEVGAY